jgi:acetyl esterase/lipase
MSPTPLDRQLDLTGLRVAELRLRDGTWPLPARVYWPRPRGPSSPLLVFLASRDGAAEADRLCRELCARAGLVVLSAGHSSEPLTFSAARAATEWAADHAAELGADPARLLLGGAGRAGGLAAAVAVHARDQGWPPIVRQLLISPDLDGQPGRAGAFTGVAPATEVAGPGGNRVAERLRAGGVAVQELRYRPDDPRLTADLADAARRAPA